MGQKWRKGAKKGRGLANIGPKKGVKWGKTGKNKGIRWIVVYKGVKQQKKSRLMERKQENEVRACLLQGTVGALEQYAHTACEGVV